ncbi:MAG: hypothetical protein F7B18_05190 [Desulfurococcales archaeon]|nr:hypothetical protein [Desulfurococcales archaeon]
MASIRVETGARLHAGFYTIDAGWGVQWGGSGFYIDQLGITVEAWECREPGVEAPASYREVATLVEEKLSPKVCARIVTGPPRHSGLGSTTQASLALGLAIDRLEGRGLGIEDLAKLLGRGRYSLVGTLLFMHGGFIVDPGIPGPLKPLARLEVPGDWRFVVVLPSLPRGPGEVEEEALMRPRRPGPREEALMAKGTIMLASAVARGDLGDALEALKLVQAGTGLYFSRSQGGVYRGDVSWIVGEASRDGIVLAQSSWGPALYTITDSSSAGSDASLLRSILAEAGVGGSVIVAEPRNRGAVTVLY